MAPAVSPVVAPSPTRSPGDRDPRPTSDPATDPLLTPARASLLGRLVREFEPRRLALLLDRRRRAVAVQMGDPLALDDDTVAIREGRWAVRPSTPPFLDRRVEVVGAPVPATIVPAMNSAADTFVADLDRGVVPTADRIVAAHVAIAAAVRREISYVADGGARFRLARRTALLAMKPRDLAADERLPLPEWPTAPATLADVALFVALNGHELVARGSRPFLYLPRLESAAEARFYGDLLYWLEEEVGLPPATISVAVIVESAPAIAQLEELLFELRDRSPALVLAPAGYLGALSRLYREDPRFVLPDRRSIPLDGPPLAPIARLVVETAHRRGAIALAGPGLLPQGGRTGVADGHEGRWEQGWLRRVGFDGVWLRDLGAVPSAIERWVDPRGARRPPWEPSADKATVPPVVHAPDVPLSFDGLQRTLHALVAYLAGWMDGEAIVRVDRELLDRADAELDRSLLWQWIHGGVLLEDGAPVSAGLVRELLGEEEALHRDPSSTERDAMERIRAAVRLADELVTDWDPPDAIPPPDALRPPAVGRPTIQIRAEPPVTDGF